MAKINELWSEVMSAELRRSSLLIWSGLVGMVTVIMAVQLLIGVGLFVKFSLAARALTFMFSFALAVMMASIVMRGIQLRTVCMLRMALDCIQEAKEVAP